MADTPIHWQSGLYPLTPEEQRVTDRITTALLLSVPLRIADYREWSDYSRQSLVDELRFSDAMWHGDDLMYGGKYSGPAFTALAKSVALLAFSVGGVSVFGYHWCAKSGHHMGIVGDGPCDEEIEREKREKASAA